MGRIPPCALLDAVSIAWHRQDCLRMDLQFDEKYMKNR